MLRRLLFVIALLGLAQAVSAHCPGDGSPGSYNKESITVSSTSIGFTVATYNPVAGHAVAAYVTTETDAIRIWFDGTAPTAALGHLVPAGSTIEVCGVDNVKNFRAIRVTTDATLRVSFHR